MNKVVGEEFLRQNKVIVEKLTFFLEGMKSPSVKKITKLITIMLNNRMSYGYMNIDNLSSKILFFWQKNMPEDVYEKIIRYKPEHNMLILDTIKTYELSVSDMRLKDNPYKKHSMRIFDLKTNVDTEITKPENVEFNFKENKLVKASDLVNKLVITHYKNESKKESIMSITKRFCK